VQRISRLTVVAVTFVGFAVTVLAGCESKSDAANREVLAAATKARRLHDRALSLLANPVQKISGQLDPALQPVASSPNQVEVLPSEVLNPVALESLEQAERTLSGTMSQVGRDASPYTAGVGYNLLGQICMLRGFYHATGAAEAEERARQAAQAARRLANLAAAQEGLGEFYEQLTQMEDRDLLLMRTEAAEKARQAGEQIAALEGQIAALTRQKSDLEKRIEQASVRARDLRINSRLAQKQEALKLFQEALAEEAKVNASSSEVSHIENTVELRRLSLSALKTKLTAAQQRRQLAEKLLADRQQQNAKYLKGSQDVQEALAKVNGELDAQLRQAAAAVQQAAEAAKRAAQAYQEAIGHFKTARRIGGSKTQADLNEANAQMWLADLNVRTLRSKRAMELLHKQLAEATPGGPTIEDVDEAAATETQPSEATAAAEAYRRAAELYEAVLRRTDRNVKWIYQGQLAAANLGLYALTGEAEALNSAKAALQEALDGRRGSKYLQPLEELEQLAKRL